MFCFCFNRALSIFCLSSIGAKRRRRCSHRFVGGSELGARFIILLGSALLRNRIPSHINTACWRFRSRYGYPAPTLHIYTSRIHVPWQPNPIPPLPVSIPFPSQLPFQLTINPTSTHRVVTHQSLIVPSTNHTHRSHSHANHCSSDSSSSLTDQSVPPTPAPLLLRPITAPAAPPAARWDHWAPAASTSRRWGCTGGWWASTWATWASRPVTWASTAVTSGSSTRRIDQGPRASRLQRQKFVSPMLAVVLT